MSQSIVTKIYGDYEVVITKETFWNASICSKHSNNNIAIYEKIVTNALGCNEAFQKAKEFIDTHGWKLIANYNPLKIYVRQNSENLFDYKITHDEIIIEMRSDFEDEKGIAFACAIVIIDKLYKKYRSPG